MDVHQARASLCGLITCSTGAKQLAVPLCKLDAMLAHHRFIADTHLTYTVGWPKKSAQFFATRGGRGGYVGTIGVSLLPVTHFHFSLLICIDGAPDLPYFWLYIKDT